MAEKKSVTVTIYKNEYTLKGDADPQHIIDLAHDVDRRMTEMGQKSSAPADKIAILVAMNIADELRRLEKINEDNLELIENLEKNFEEMKNNSNSTLKDAATQMDEINNLQTTLVQEKEKYQALETQVEELKVENISLKNQLETALDEQKKLNHEAQDQLKIQNESREEQESITKSTPEPTAKSSIDTPAITISAENLSRLITKINAVID